MNKRDYYEVLGVSKTATDAEIKSAFRRLAKQYHPDVSKEENAAELFKEAQEAYAVLSDPEKRRQYDQFGHAAFQNQGGGASGFDFSGFDFSDIFGDIFGEGFGGFGFGSRSSSRGRKGRDSILRMHLTFEEAAFGCEKTVNLDTMESCSECLGKGGFDEESCSKCHGSGVVNSEQKTIFGSFMSRTTCDRCGGKGKTYQKECSKCRGNGRIKVNKDVVIKVPAGVNTGNQLRLAGKGEAGSNGGGNGDLYIEFTVKDHPLFQREDNDIYLELPITITDAVLGGKKEVPTLDGTVKLSIPAGSKTGDKHRLKGKGIEDVHSYRKGDMFVVLKVIPPKKLTRDQKRLFEELLNTPMDDAEEFRSFNKYMNQ